MRFPITEQIYEAESAWKEGSHCLTYTKGFKLSRLLSADYMEAQTLNSAAKIGA